MSTQDSSTDSGSKSPEEVQSEVRNRGARWKKLSRRSRIACRLASYSIKRLITCEAAAVPISSALSALRFEIIPSRSSWWASDWLG
jgi:hypothetical protein